MRVKKAGVVGAGAMGSAIAELLAFNGIDVWLNDVSAPAVEQGLARVRSIVEELVRFHESRADRELEKIRELGVTLTAEQVSAVRSRLAPKVSRSRGEEILARVHGTVDLAPFRDVDLAIEAVFEQEAAKRSVFESLDRLLGDGAVLASNTSSLSISRLARGLGHVRSTLVLHFFNPPSQLPLVEVAGGVDTREELLDEAVELIAGWRNHRYPMLPIRVKESPGYLVNRILVPVLNEACFALESGVASARDIDAAMKAGAGLPMGPFELADLVGLDVSLEVAESLAREFGDPKYRPSVLLKHLVDAGHLGRKTGRGFYEYA